MGVYVLKITVMDIENKEFKRGFRGYDVDDVDEFLEDIAEDYETLYKENSSLKERLEVLEEKLENYRKLESTINSTLVMAQNNSEQLKKNSEDQAELIINRANESAQRVIDNSHGEVLKINSEFDRVKNEFMSFKSKYKNFMKTQTELFDELEKDFARNFSISHTEPSNSSSKIMVNEIDTVLKEQKIEQLYETDMMAKEPINELENDEAVSEIEKNQFSEAEELETEIDSI